MPSKIDLTGQQFSYLTVIKEEFPRSNPKKVKWVCKCACGNIINVTTSDLKSGHTKSCGKCGIFSNKNNITGLRSNKVVALEPTEKRTSSGNVLWKCQCDCGKLLYVRSDIIKNKKIKSCGCDRIEKITEQNHQKFIDLTGQKFGKLLVLEKAEKPEHAKARTIFWRCKCDCGKEVIVNGSSLRSKKTQSCGCLNAENTSHGELKIRNVLINNNIPFESEKIFSDLIFSDTKKFARFDFYLPQHNILIEYDGSQHFYIGKGIYDSPEQVKRIQERDKIKNEYAKSKGIKLIRIPYWEYDNIDLDMILGKREI